MTEIAQPSIDTAPLDPLQLLLPSLTAMVQDLVHMLPPTSVVQALQAKQLLQQMGNAVQVMQLRSVARVMQAMEAPLEGYAQTGHALADKAGELLQLAARDLHAYLLGLTSETPVDVQTLFASYRALVKLGGKDTAHPADLWDRPWSAPNLDAPEGIAAIAPSAELRAQLDQHVLALLRTNNPIFCNTLQELSLGLAAHAPQPPTWQLAATWLEAVEYGLLDFDLYAKRMASRLLAHYAGFAKGQHTPPDGLLQELLFFCAQAAQAAEQRKQPLPHLLDLVQMQCAQAQSAAQPPATAQPVAEPASDTRITHIVPQARPALAPALPEFASATEIQPAQTLVKGLVSAAQVEPDLEFLQAAESLSEKLEADLAAWLSSEEAELPQHTADDVGELSRLAWGCGCTEIASLSHMLQRCLLRMQANTTLEQRKTCQYAGEEIRRLLHQFAAGFMRRTHPQVMDALHKLYAQLPEPVLNFQLNFNVEEGAANTQAEPAPDTDTASAATSPAAEPTLPVANAPLLDAMHFSIFEEEMLAVWPKLHSALKQWMGAPSDASARQTVLRCLHTLKGSARLAGAMAWASQVHAVEGLALEVPLEDGPRGPASLPQPVEALRVAFVALQQEVTDRQVDRNAGPIEAVALHAQALWSTQEAGEQALKASHHSLQEIADSLSKLRGQIKDCAAWADTLMLHGDIDLPYEWHEELHDLIHALNDCADDLGTGQQQLQYSLSDTTQAFNTHGGHLRALQHTLLYAGLAPLSQMQERLERCVELAARDTGKDVQLHWQGADTSMQRHVLEAIAPALEHLLRNCVAHGIEAKAQRTAAGKDAQGHIHIALHSDAQHQMLSLWDDGAGLDVEHIRHRAVALGLVSEEEAVDAARAAQLILQPGLSTSSHLSELAGRGIGMDAVAAAIEEIGGRLHITSTSGQGCRFDISLPPPPQVEQVLALRAGNWRVAVPATSVETLRRIPQDVADQAMAQGVLHNDAAGPLPLYWAGAVWQQSSRSLEPPLDGQRQLLIVRSDTARWGLIVDEVLGTQEVTLQAAPDLEVPIAGLLGTAAQPSGQVLQVYEPRQVLSAHEARLLTQQPNAHACEASDAEPERPLVLLADDSTSVRRLAQHLLQSSGFRVVTAADGLEALQLLEDGELPSMLLVDVEMPGMDGMELLRRVRAEARWQHLPVVMLTAHTAGPVSQKAIDMGAQAFLTKPYSPNELLAQVRRYTAVQAAV